MHPRRPAGAFRGAPADISRPEYISGKPGVRRATATVTSQEVGLFSTPGSASLDVFCGYTTSPLVLRVYGTVEGKRQLVAIGRIDAPPQDAVGTSDNRDACVVSVRGRMVEQWDVTAAPALTPGTATTLEWTAVTWGAESDTLPVSADLYTYSPAPFGGGAVQERADRWGRILAVEAPPETCFALDTGVNTYAGGATIVLMANNFTFAPNGISGQLSGAVFEKWITDISGFSTNLVHLQYAIRDPSLVVTNIFQETVLAGASFRAVLRSPIRVPIGYDLIILPSGAAGSARFGVHGQVARPYLPQS